MTYKIAVLPGDGIGPEVMRVAVDVLQAIATRYGHRFDLHYGICGAHAIDAVGDPFPDETLRLCQSSDAVLFGAVGDPRYDHDPNSPIRPEQGLLKMRKGLGLYANIRPIATWNELRRLSPLREDLVSGVDFVVIRELTGGMYFGKHYRDNNEAYDTCYYSRSEIERIVRVGFETARKRKHRLTVVDKANILESSRLWRQIAQEMEAHYPDVATDYMFVDYASMRMIADPRHFDVIVTENTFGDILTDEAAVISGSMGLLPSASLGTGTPLFEPVHGSWPQAAGKDLANPLAMVLCVAMMLEHLGLEDEGSAVRRAVEASINQGIRTPDLLPESQFGTTAVGEFLVNELTTRTGYV